METIGTCTPDNLFDTAKFPDMRDTRTIPAGVEIKRGHILNTDFEPIKDGDEPDSIALEDLAAAATVRVIAVCETGAFNVNALITGDSKTANEWKAELRKLSIFVRHPAP